MAHAICLFGSASASAHQGGSAIPRSKGGEPRAPSKGGSTGCWQSGSGGENSASQRGGNERTHTANGGAKFVGHGVGITTEPFPYILFCLGKIADKLALKVSAKYSASTLDGRDRHRSEGGPHAPEQIARGVVGLLYNALLFFGFWRGLGRPVYQEANYLLVSISFGASLTKLIIRNAHAFPGKKVRNISVGIAFR